ncbi:Uncharacterised protein [Escherichia coli]|uniref:Uncharacterized protein n=1 Tax=Escherichia coli TaxID=562 RepID=A0A2X1KUQ5_ECOLX|nr:hypothetical protein [Escherichia coli]SPW39395.1 Uncharacterised protein [Escherichia coli]HAI2056276.1 hypothetical protein [Escherichia coli]HBB9181470.1 hypothetical protein [Escherichia coli]HCK1887621.1 hypothetical protein [Escherichia coli]
MCTIFVKKRYNERLLQMSLAIMSLGQHYRDKSSKDLRRKLNRMVRSLKKIEKDFEHYKNSYEPPEIIEISPRDCGVAGFYVMSCWRDDFEIYTRETREELFSQDKDFFLKVLDMFKLDINSIKRELIAEGFLTEADFIID